MMWLVVAVGVKVQYGARSASSGVTALMEGSAERGWRVQKILAAWAS